MTPNECEGFQIAIEMRLHGAADPNASKRLDLHLSSCPECRDFEATAKETENTMRIDADRVGKTIDWAQLRGRVHKLMKWKSPSGAAATICLAFLAIQAMRWIDSWVLGQPFTGPDWTVTFAWLLTMIALFFFFNGRRLREAKRAQASREKLIEFYRKELDRQIRETRLTLAGLAILGCLVAFPLVSELHRGLSSLKFLSSSLLFEAFLVGSFLFAYLRELPRLRRERTELA